MAINKTQLINLAGEAAYQRGIAVYKNGGVLSIRKKAGYIFAKVAGTHIYQVKLKITNKTLNGSCDCPASENIDFCKHCVATALAYQEKKAEQDEVQDESLNRIAAYIHQLSEQEAKHSLLQLIANDDLLTSKWQLKADNASGSIDIKQLKKQITKALPYRSFWEYAKVRAYFAQAEAVLEPIFTIFSDLHVEEVFSLAQYMSQRLNKLLERMDDSGGYRFNLENQIHDTLTITFKQLPWSANKKAQFLVQALMNEEESMIYPEIPGEFLDKSTQDVSELFFQSIQNTWDALPNLQHGASYSEKSPYNTLLYILLHQTTTEINTEKEITLKTKLAIEVRDFIELAELNLREQPTDKHIQQAEYWLKKAQTHPDKFSYATDIKRLQITVLESKQQPEKASEILWKLFTKTEQFTDYQQLQSLAEKSGVDKITCYQMAESILIKNTLTEQHSRWRNTSYNLIEFYLKNKETNKAAEYAKDNSVEINQLQRIAKHSLLSDISLAFEFYQRIVMYYPKNSNNEAYQHTIDALIELKQGLPDETEWDEKFEVLLNEIKKAYKPKRNLMKLLAQHFN